jgi:hypothetical protein
LARAVQNGGLEVEYSASVSEEWDVAIDRDRRESRDPNEPLSVEIADPATPPVAPDLVEPYDPALVATLLQADREKPEAVFTRVTDMLDWLDAE